jgi:hypothetical protein
MMSLAGASRAVVPALAGCPVTPLAAALDPGAPAPGARPSAVGAATADPEAAEAAELADVAEHPASSIPPASMTPPIARAAAPNRMRLVRADRRFKLSVFHMLV